MDGSAEREPTTSAARRSTKSWAWASSITRSAQAALPKALRVYNDYALEMDNRDQETKRRALLGLIDAFQRNGTPIDAVGLQSHLRLDGTKFNEQVYRQFLRDIASRGIQILITELDVWTWGRVQRRHAGFYWQNISGDDKAWPHYVEYGPLYAGTYGFRKMRNIDGQLWEFFPEHRTLLLHPGPAAW